MTSDLLTAERPPADPSDPVRPSRPGVARPWWVVAVVVVVVAALAWWLTRPRIEDPRPAAESLAATWTRDGLGAIAFASEPTAPPADDLAAIVADLEGSATVRVLSVAEPDEAQRSTTARLAVDWLLSGDRTWQYETTATLLRAPEALTWEVAWNPRLVHPDLAVGEHLEVGRTPAARGRILDARGDVLVGPERVTRVGLHPSRIEDLDETVGTLVQALRDDLDVDLDAEEIRADVAAADPDHVVPVVVLRNDDYRAVESVVYPLPGTTFRDDVLYLSSTRDFAPFTLGSVGAVTAEQLEESPGRWEPGDVAGRSGLQAAHDRAMAGTPGWSVAAVDADGALRADLHEVAPIVGGDVTVTLDRRIQDLAQAALDDVDTPAALAVVRPSDGAVLALANSSAATFDVARSGQLPPGSVFKVVSAAALMQDAGVDADTPVGCPNTIDVAGRTVSNAGSLALGDTTFDRGFANSCNTVFIDLSDGLGASSLADAGRQFGLGEDVTWPLGLPAFTGSVPVTDDRWEQSLASFGQGRTLSNPLALSTVMATVARGERVLPRLVLDPAGEDGSPDADPLPADVATTLQDLTRLVVTDGSGSALEDLPGAEVHGKTGSAEYTTEDGGRSQHVWFAGYREDLAFALVVTDVPDGSGGGTAAPLVRDFLAALED